MPPREARQRTSDCPSTAPATTIERSNRHPPCQAIGLPHPHHLHPRLYVLLEEADHRLQWHQQMLSPLFFVFQWIEEEKPIEHFVVGRVKHQRPKVLH